MEMRARGLRPVLVTGLNPSRLGHLTRDVLERHPPTAEAPVVLQFDEYDELVELAVAGMPQHKTYALDVRDRQTLCRYLDWLGGTMHIYMVATSNKLAQWWADEQYSFAARQGRFVFEAELPPLGGDDLVAAIESGCRLYGMETIPTRGYEGVQMPMMALAAAFRTSRGEPRRLAESLAAQPRG